MLTRLVQSGRFGSEFDRGDGYTRARTLAYSRPVMGVPTTWIDVPISGWAE
jgi:hypothetical protein